jgi:hypothetical protein
LFSTHIHTNNTGNVTTQKYIEQHKKYIEQHNNYEECGPCPVVAGFTLAFALQMKKKHGKTSVRAVIHEHTMRIHSHNNKNTLITLLNRNETLNRNKTIKQKFVTVVYTGIVAIIIIIIK